MLLIFWRSHPLSLLTLHCVCSIPGHPGRQKHFGSTPFPIEAVLPVKTRVDLKNSPYVGEKDPGRNLSGAKWAHPRKYNMVSIFLCWREQVLSKGSWPGSPPDTWARRRKHRVDFQGGKSSRPHPLSRKHCKAWSCWELGALFGPQQRKPSTSFFFSLQHCLRAWSQSCKGDNRNKRGQWLGDTVSKSKSGSFQPLASNELRASKIYTISMSNLNLLVSPVCSKHGKPCIPSLFIKGFFFNERNYLSPA